MELRPDEVVSLVAALTDGLAQLAEVPPPPADPAAARLAGLESRGPAAVLDRLRSAPRRL